MTSIFKNVVDGNTVTTFGIPHPKAEFSTIIDTIKKNSWYTIYSATFSGEPTDNGFVFNGAEWTKINEQNSQYFIQNENGLEIQVNQNPSEWFNTNRTAPGILLDLNKIINENNKILGNPLRFETRIVAELSGSKFSHNYEDISFGLETKMSRPDYNFVSISRYYDYEKQNQLRTSFIKTTNGCSVENDFSAKEEPVVVFNIKNFQTIEAFTSPTTDFFKSPETTDLEKGLHFVFNWSFSDTSQDKKPLFSNVNDLNVIFSVGTSFDYRDVVGNIKQIIIQVKQK